MNEELVAQWFELIRETSSITEKTNILRSHSNDELFKKCLRFLYDNNIVTGLNKSKIHKAGLKLTENLDTLTDAFTYLVNNNTGRDIDIIYIQSFLAHIDEQYKWFYEGLFTKSLKLGCDSTLVNKAIPKLIPTWDVQLGSGFDNLKLKPNEYFYISQKLNGNRCSYLDGKLISRQGKEFTGFDYIIKDIEQYFGTEYFIDGELIRINNDGCSDGENFRIGTGIINSDAEYKPGFKLVVFDAFPKQEFIQNKKSSENYSKRKQQLIAAATSISSWDKCSFEIVNMLYEGTDTKMIDTWLDYAVAHDWEGCMINKDKPYVCKRTTDLIKVKRFYTVDLTIINIISGDGRLSDTLGAIVVQYKNNTVNVGSGFTDEQRKYIWEHAYELIGKIIEVKYKEVTKDKTTGLESLQFPVFVQLRDDKTFPSYN